VCVKRDLDSFVCVCGFVCAGVSACSCVVRVRAWYLWSVRVVRLANVSVKCVYVIIVHGACAWCICVWRAFEFLQDTCAVV
jgi:hypothetical protein